MFRTLIERLSRGVVLKRRLPSSVGGSRIYVTPDAQLKYLKPGASAFDSKLLRVAQELVAPRCVVWDIGANVGVFALAAAGLIRDGSVLAVEPDLHLTSLIRRSIQRLSPDAASVRSLAAAVSNADGVASLAISKRGRASNSLEEVGGRSQMGGVRHYVDVPTLTLDTLLGSFDAPQVVKVDVEGAEVLALQGAGRLLSEIRPILLIEVGQSQNREATRVLKDADYALYDADIPKAERLELEACAFNTLAMPR